MGWVAKSAVVAGVGLAAAGAVWVVGMRDKDSVVVAVQRQLNKKVFNPKMLETAGAPGSQASLLRHVGRTSGTAYATPLGAVPTEDGFVIALVYGRGSDWLRNVLAAGVAQIDHEGQHYQVADPEILPIAEAASWLPASVRQEVPFKK